MRRVLIITTACMTAAFGCFAQSANRERGGERRWAETIPAGTQIQIRNDRPVDVSVRSDGRIYTATVAEDVYGPDSHLLIPRGAGAELIVQNVGQRQLQIDLDSITVDGRRYMVDADIYRASRKTGIGANRRTGEYVGGGAVLGGIIGAIAGGGKGAAIGAIAGGAAGGGVQILTRGEALHIPAESILTFRLDYPLRVAVPPYDRDNGYDENGYHYHNGYYDRRGNGR